MGTKIIQPNYTGHLKMAKLVFLFAHNKHVTWNYEEKIEILTYNLFYAITRKK